jgi:outer membrane lipase/esterase
MRYLKITVAVAFWLVLEGCSSSGSEGDASAETVPPPPDDPIPAPSALFVLGDSLSDVGNAAGLADFVLSLSIFPPTVGLCNPIDVLVLSRPCDNLFYNQSRVSDGPTAVEYLAAHFGLAELVPSLHFIPNPPVTGTAYAVASAKARVQGVEDLSNQVDMLLLDHGSVLPADALYVVIIGGNDVIDALQAAVEGAMDPQLAATIVTAAVTAIGTNVERLLDFGARRLIVANVPDLATLPAVRADALASGDEAAVLATASGISDTFNTELDALLNDIENSGRAQLELARFDLHAALSAAQNAAAANGDNVLDACFDSDAYRDSSIADRVFHPDCEPVQDDAPRFANFVFWDGIHPTGATHAAIGTALIELLTP